MDPANRSIVSARPDIFAIAALNDCTCLGDGAQAAREFEALVEQAASEQAEEDLEATTDSTPHDVADREAEAVRCDIALRQEIRSAWALVWLLAIVPAVAHCSRVARQYIILHGCCTFLVHGS